MKSLNKSLLFYAVKLLNTTPVTSVWVETFPNSDLNSVQCWTQVSEIRIRYSIRNICKESTSRIWQHTHWKLHIILPLGCRVHWLQWCGEVVLFTEWFVRFWILRAIRPCHGIKKHHCCDGPPTHLPDWFRPATTRHHAMTTPKWNLISWSPRFHLKSQNSKYVL